MAGPNTRRKPPTADSLQLLVENPWESETGDRVYHAPDNPSAREHSPACGRSIDASYAARFDSVDDSLRCSECFD